MYDFDTPVGRMGTNSLKWDVGEGELPMWVADMDFATAPEVCECISARAKSGIFGYTVVPQTWYGAICSWWEKRHGFRIEKEWLQFCTGVIPAISCLVQRLTNVGDKIALFTPSYDIFFHSIENFGRHVLECPLRYQDGAYSIDFGALESALSDPLTTMFLLCNPHNPTGKVWRREELAKIGALCKKYGVLVLSDEIHGDLTLPHVGYTPFASVSKDCAQNSVTCISASKAFNLAGLQSAAVVVPNENLRKIVVRGLNSCEVAEPNCFAAEATIAAFEKGGPWLDELRAYLEENRRVATEYLRAHAPALRVTEAEATYLLWIDCAAYTQNSTMLCAFLKEKYGLILTAGKEFRGNGASFVRMNIACPRARMLEGLKRLTSGLASFRP